MPRILKRYFLHIALPLFAFGLGISLGVNAGESPEQRIAMIAEHDKHVRAATEQAAKRYSVCLMGDYNLLPEWAQEPRTSVFDLDEYYRDPALGWPAPDRDPSSVR